MRVVGLAGGCGLVLMVLMGNVLLCFVFFFTGWCISLSVDFNFLSRTVSFLHNLGDSDHFRDGSVGGGCFHRSNSVLVSFTVLMESYFYFRKKNLRIFRQFEEAESAGGRFSVLVLTVAMVFGLFSPC